MRLVAVWKFVYSTFFFFFSLSILWNRQEEGWKSLFKSFLRRDSFWGIRHAPLTPLFCGGRGGGGCGVFVGRNELVWCRMLVAIGRNDKYLLNEAFWKPDVLSEACVYLLRYNGLPLCWGRNGGKFGHLGYWSELLQYASYFLFFSTDVEVLV